MTPINTATPISEVETWPTDDPDFRGLVVTKTMEEARGVMREVQWGYRSPTDARVNFTTNAIIYPSGARVLVRKIASYEDTYQIAGHYFHKVCWMEPAATTEIYQALMYRVRWPKVETPFTGPDLKTEKGPLPYGTSLLSDGGCPVCGMRNKHAPTCDYAGSVREPRTMHYTGYDTLTIEPSRSALGGIDSAGNIWWGADWAQPEPPRKAVEGDIYPRLTMAEVFEAVAEHVTRSNLLYRRLTRPDELTGTG